MPDVLKRYDPRRWCADPSCLWQAAYAGVIAYRQARAVWLEEEHGMGRARAWQAAGDGTRLGPHWVVPRGDD